MSTDNELQPMMMATRKESFRSLRAGDTVRLLDGAVVALQSPLEGGLWKANGEGGIRHVGPRRMVSVWRHRVGWCELQP